MLKPFSEIVDEITAMHGIPRICSLEPVVTHEGRIVSAVWFIDKVNHGIRLVVRGPYGVELHGWNHAGLIKSATLVISKDSDPREPLRLIAKLIGLLPDEA